jgi:hypothetical protein
VKIIALPNRFQAGSIWKSARREEGSARGIGFTLPILPPFATQALEFPSAARQTQQIFDDFRLDSARNLPMFPARRYLFDHCLRPSATAIDFKLTGPSRRILRAA